jgi:hypothetical protein
MSAPEFDKYPEDYEAMHRESIAFSGCEPTYFAEYKVAFAASLLRNPSTIVDFGACIGNCMAHFRRYFPQGRKRLTSLNRFRVQSDSGGRRKE